MIAIVNVGPHDDPDKLGVRTYEVRINANVVCTFKHRRADGLGMCLLKASKAVERQKWEQASRILDIANGKTQPHRAAELPITKTPTSRCRLERPCYMCGYWHHFRANLSVAKRASKAAGRQLLLAGLHFLHGVAPCKYTDHHWWGI